MENENSRDRWSKFDISAKALAAILLPVVIFYFTYQQQRSNELRLQQEKTSEERKLEQQRMADLAQRNADRVTVHLNHLASNNPNERRLSLQVLSFFARNNQFPDELLAAVILATDDKDPGVANASSATLAQAAKSNPETARAIVKASQSNPNTARVLSDAVTKNPDLATAIKKVEPSSFPQTSLEATSNPQGATVFLVPLMLGNLVGPGGQFRIGTTPVTAQVFPANYACIFELNGRRIARNVSVRSETAKVHVDF
jgi:hypothetical protein